VLFTDNTGETFSQMSTNEHNMGAAVILKYKNASNLLTPTTLTRIRKIVQQIENISYVISVDIVVPNNTADVTSLGLNVTSDGLVTSENYVTKEEYEYKEGKLGWRKDVKVMTIKRLVTWNDVCARLQRKCQTEGGFFVSERFEEEYRQGNVQYPFWDSPWGAFDVTRVIGDPTVTDNGTLLAAGAVRLIFYLRRDNQHYKRLSLEWENRFVEATADMNFGDLEEAHGSSYSLSQELDRGTRGDLYLFALTFVMMIAYASVVTCGGDCVESRALLAIGGVVAAVLGISASLGLVSLLGVPFVNIAGCMPFLVLGIGVDDMFLLMAAWSGTLGNRDLSIPERLGSTIRAAGIGITITSLTDGLAFAVGTVSVFESVRNFCFYTGVAVFGCYVCNLTFLAGCMALHGRRVYSGRHTVTCRKVKLRHELKAEGGSSLGVLCCSGNIPEKNGADESLCERAPRLLLPRLVLWRPMKIVIFICFAGFLGVSIWGASGLEQGLRIKNLVLPTSYYYKYNTWEEDIFGTTFPISFVIDQPLDYTDEKASTELKELFDKARDDPDINHLTLFCWLVDYYLSPYFTTTSNKDFVDNLRFKFLPENPQYQNDIVIDEDSDVITASRCHVFTRDAKESTRQAGIMLRMRKLAEESDLNVFAFQPAFVYFEQYAAIVPNTLFTVGVTLAAMCVVSFFLLAHPLMVCLVLFNVVMIVIGIFGFMSLWGLTLSSVTMIHLIMSVGFSVDFSAHVCAAYMTSLECTRHARARQALTHASGPILNGGLSSLVGISVLCVSDSYIFQSFFKIMFLVILFGVLHAVFLMPVILSLVGPELKMPSGSDVREQTITVPSAPPTNASVSNYGTLGEDATNSGTVPGSVSKVELWLGSAKCFDNKAFVE
ncbi:hypothetical protein BaRGS_00028777, partial [Batillaria attramentaria]